MQLHKMHERNKDGQKYRSTLLAGHKPLINVLYILSSFVQL